jgi:hypothetical protein
MPEEIIADVPNEGDKVEGTNAIDQALTNIQDKGEKTPAESQSGNKQLGKEPSQEGKNTPDEQNIPFHKHPRWIKLNQTNKDLQAKLAEIDARLQEREKAPATTAPQEQMPQWWINAYGNTPESQQAYRTYQENTNAERQRIKDDILNEIQGAQKKEVLSQEEAEGFITGEIDAMHEEGLDFETNELMKFIVDRDKNHRPLLDSEGNYDLREYLEIKNSLQPKLPDNSMETKKRIASDTLSSKTSPQESKVPVINTRTLRNGNWRDAI